MTTDDVLPVLEKQSHFIRGFQPAQVRKLAGLAKQVHFERDQIIFREDDERYEFYLIVSGLVALEIAPQGQAFRVDTLVAGDELGWSSVLMDKGKLFQARALEPTEALMFAGADLRAMCEEDTAFGYALMMRLLGVVSERLQATRLQVLDMYWPVAARAGA
ncbi:MAG: cyclic nucleotide-binding domain-containing protein [Betaproteobacteria bacterium]